jgi:hypothetical protein
MMNKDQQANQLAFGGQVMSAFNAGKPEIGIDLLRQKAEGYKNAGRTDQAQMFDTWAKLAEVNPDMAARSMGTMIAALPGGEKTLEGVTKLSADARAQEMQPLELEAKKWGIKNIQSEIGNRSAMLGLRAQEVNATVAEKMASIQDKLYSLPEHAQKLVNESATAAAVSKQSASKMNDLAGEVDKRGSSWGSANSLGEWSKKALGNEDFRPTIQNEYTRMTNSEAIKAYKASGATGGFSDADLATALEGIPKSTANPETMAKFLRGMAKMQDINASMDNAKTDWLSSNKGQLNRANSSFIAGDYAVKAGETYADFSQRIAKDVAKRYTSKNEQAEDNLKKAIPQIPTKSGNALGSGMYTNAAADAIIAGGR